ncbi:MAG: tetratricopeptide repeat protein [Chloroflexi bacterium]|nr:tetratricopeptide repeat protein [Chloroflexota bacterium]
MVLVLSSCDEIATPPPAYPTLTSVPTVAEPAMPTREFPIESTPASEETLAEADRVLAFGDYDQALRLYSVNTTGSSVEIQAAALYGQGLTYYKQNDLFQAKRMLLELQERFPESLPAKRANFVLAQISLEQELEEEALDYYQAYTMEQSGMIEAEVNFRIGDLLAASGDTEATLQAYRKAYLAPQLGNNTAAAIKVASSYASLGQDDLALGIYKEILLNTGSDYTRAQMNLLIARILIDQGSDEEAYTYLQDSVTNYPFSYDAYTALVMLLDAGQSVDDLQRGIINYNVNQYLLAIEAFDRYLAGEGFAKDEALYYKALSVRAEGLVRAGFSSPERLAANAAGGTVEDKEAIQLWNELIATYPQSQYRFDAIEDIIYTQNTYMGALKLALETTLAYVSAPNAQPDAPQLLQIAGNYYFLDGQIKEAADSWTRIALEFPASTEAFNGLFFGGSLYYELGEYDKAIDNFNRALLIANPGTLEESGSYFWLGKVNKARGDRSAALTYWQSAVERDPFGYYGIRSSELVNDQPLFPPVNTGNLQLDLESERKDAADWLKTAFSLPSEINVDYSSEIAQDARYKRAIEFHRLGLYNLASQEFESLRLTYYDDALNSFRLIDVFLNLGYYQSAIEASRSISKLAGYGDVPLSANYPPYFAHVQYGTYYLPWIEQVAARFKIPELLIFSLIYQESRFAAHAYSSAGASGLMQLMPGTAEQIASETGYPPNYVPSDLGVPYYNLELGTNYLARQLFVFDGDLYYALAAYNGGPGNTLRWKDLTSDDPDLFLNSVRYLETRTYLRRIVEIYHIYSLIYGN